MTLLGKPGCHLCDEARVVVQGVLADHPEVAFEERSILDDPALLDAYVEEIPVGFTHVLLLNEGRVVAAGPVAETLTAESLTETFGVPILLSEDGGRYAARAGS